MSRTRAYPQNRLYVNLVRQLDTPSLLRVGSTFTFEAYARYGSGPTVNSSIPFVSLAPAAISLAPLGKDGIDPTQMIALQALPIPQPAGMGSVGFAVPNAPTLVGVSIYAQALLLGSAGVDRLTSVTVDTLIK